MAFHVRIIEVVFRENFSVFVSDIKVATIVGPYALLVVIVVSWPLIKIEFNGEDFALVIQ